MTTEHRLSTPLSENDVMGLKSGDVVFLTGVLYTARDAAHKRLVQALDRGEALPFSLEGAVIYYVGPSPAPLGRVIGSAGPTTSGRMDVYAQRLHSLGLKATIGKGGRGQELRQALTIHKAVYFGATGGAGALLSLCVKSARVIAFPGLGPEAVRELMVENFPVLVVNDAYGGELYAKPDLAAVGLTD